ncbi:MAG: non-heme iron oxygenase ferredoxin subunit [Gemmatimonadota bacterium]|nr:non-heme iron oxygenase ferredoxin subunit [Gemmatimonadota bacterium]MDH3427060.1 non-heme iron oxygenase ferredoxin subunit [Gemmatimonadota bacterium]
MREFRTVARLEDVPDAGLHAVELDGIGIVLANSGGEILALRDECSHEEFPLSDGEIVNGQVECILHGARFDLRTGAAKALPAVRPVKAYECRVLDGEIQVRL